MTEKKIILLLALIVFSIFIVGCSQSNQETKATETRVPSTQFGDSNNNDGILTKTVKPSWDYSDLFYNSVDVTETSSKVTIESDGLPDHDTGSFPNSGNPNRISEQDHEFSFTTNPSESSQTTSGRGYVFGIALNGIPIEPFTGEFYNGDRTSGWNLEWSTNDLGFDFNNAHVQPTGTYHYHGEPTSLLEDHDHHHDEPILVGFAADGFPIYHEDLESSYRLKSGTRPSGPGGRYDGTYVEDYEYVEGLGDLDECNGYYGETEEYPDGTYYYVISEEFPIISRCFTGTPDSSFRHGGGAAPGGQANIGSGRPGSGGGPPQEAVNACDGKSSGSSCSFTAPHGTVSGNCRSIDEDLACAPSGGPPR